MCAWAFTTVSVGVTSDDEALGVDPATELCDDFNLDLTFDAALTIYPQSDLHHLGHIRFVGLSLMTVILAISAGFAIFVAKHRETRVLKVMQPVFLEVWTMSSVQSLRC